MENLDLPYTSSMKAIFLLNSIHWILSSLSAIFLTLGNFKKSSTFCRPYFAGQNRTLLIGETFFSSKPSYVVYRFKGNFMRNKFY